MNWQQYFEKALPYDAFLEQYGTEEHRRRWQGVYERVALTPAQKEVVSGFTRKMPVLVLAGTWCGDCVNQCPILRRIEEANDVIDIRYLDRDAHPELQEALKINGGARVPVVVFLSEDFYECGRYGDRVLAFYRQMAHDRLGPACPLGVVPPADELLQAATQEWVNEFERIHLMLRLSTRLREKHGD